MYDAGPGTPHGVWPLEAADDLEPGGTAARHLCATLSGTAKGSQGNLMLGFGLRHYRRSANICYCRCAKPDDDKSHCRADEYRADEINHQANYLNPSHCTTVLCSARARNSSDRSQ